MNPRFLLDTHVVVRWFSDPRKLSREQNRVLDEAIRRGERIGVSAVSLLEIVLLGERRKLIGAGVDDLLSLYQLDTNPACRILPLTSDIAQEVGALGSSLRDPIDRAIVATARIHRLRLLTSDQRIVQSDLVAVIE